MDGQTDRTVDVDWNVDRQITLNRLHYGKADPQCVLGLFSKMRGQVWMMNGG